MEVLKIKLRQRVLIPLIAVLVVLTAAVVYTERKVEFGKLSDRHLKDLRRMEWMLDEKFDDAAAVYEILTRQLCQDTALEQAFLAGDRDALLKRIEPQYSTFNHDYDITHLYFHRPDKTCFLRVHKPTLFDDVIDRHTLAATVRQGKSHYGIELGPLGTLTLRYVYPWQVDGKLIGYVEMGREIDGLIDELKYESGFELAVLVEKQFLNRSDWEEGLRMLQRTSSWNLFKDAVVAGCTLEEFPESCIGHIEDDCFHQSNCHKTLFFKQQKKTYAAGCLGLTDAEATHIGRIYVFSDITESAAIITQSSLFFGVMCLAAGFAASIFFYFYIGQVERQLKETHCGQKIEIMHRRFAEAQLKEAKDRAEAANRAKSQFLANMSHELRTPMNAILGFSELLKDETLSEEQHDYVETIYSSSKHLLTLINDVLDISKIEAGRLEINVERCSLKRLLNQIDTMMRQAAEAKGLAFRVEADPSLPDEMVTDSQHLYQCLINLVGNSIKFTSEGHVIVRAGTLLDGDVTHVRFDIEDTGIGIAKDKQGLVFESFRQADAGTSRKYGGTGLGLSISRQLIELMGGMLILHSEAGKGSTFTITLPYESVVEQESETL